MRRVPKISALHRKFPVMRIFQSESVEVERAASPNPVPNVSNARFAQMSQPVEESFARNKSYHPEPMRDSQKISAVHWKVPVTRILPSGSEDVEEAISIPVPHQRFAQRSHPVEESFATKISDSPEHVRDCPNISAVQSKFPVTRILSSESILTDIHSSVQPGHQAFFAQMSHPVEESLRRKASFIVEVSVVPKKLTAPLNLPVTSILQDESAATE